MQSLVVPGVEENQVALNHTCLRRAYAYVSVSVAGESVMTMFVCKEGECVWRERNACRLVRLSDVLRCFFYVRNFRTTAK